MSYTSSLFFSSYVFFVFRVAPPASLQCLVKISRTARALLRGRSGWSIWWRGGITSITTHTARFRKTCAPRFVWICINGHLAHHLKLMHFEEFWRLKIRYKRIHIDNFKKKYIYILASKTYLFCCETMVQSKKLLLILIFGKLPLSRAHFNQCLHIAKFADS